MSACKIEQRLVAGQARHREQQMRVLKGFLLRCEARSLVRWSGRLAPGKAQGAREYWAALRDLEAIVAPGRAPLFELTFHRDVMQNDPYQVARARFQTLCADMHAERQRP